VVTRAALRRRAGQEDPAEDVQVSQVHQASSLEGKKVDRRIEMKKLSWLVLVLIGAFAMPANALVLDASNNDASVVELAKK
jgi:hypothetical protein